MSLLLSGRPVLVCGLGLETTGLVYQRMPSHFTRLVPSPSSVGWDEWAMGKWSDYLLSPRLTFWLGVNLFLLKCYILLTVTGEGVSWRLKVVLWTLFLLVIRWVQHPILFHWDFIELGEKWKGRQDYNQSWSEEHTNHLERKDGRFVPLYSQFLQGQIKLI